MDRTALVQVARVLIDLFLAAHPAPPETLILAFDATDDPVHGHQEGRSFHGSSDHSCSLPRDVTCGDELLVAELRPSNLDASRHARAILNLLVRRRRAAWPEVKITIRAESGSCRWRLMRWCDRNGIGSVLGLARDPVLEPAARDGTERAERQLRRTGPPQRLFGSFASAAASWDRRRRVIVQAEHTAQGTNPRFVAAHVPGDPQALAEEVSCQRGEAEDRIKEQQLDLFADRTSCHRFLAHQFRLLLSSAADVLVQALRRTALAGTELAGARVGTIRLKLLKVAARVVVSVRRVVFHLSRSYPSQRLFTRAWDRVIGGGRIGLESGGTADDRDAAGLPGWGSGGSSMP